MNLFDIARSFWQHKWAAIPVIILTAIGMIYVLEANAPTYGANAYVLLEDPPSPPSAGQIQVDPKLALVNANNPLASLQNLDQVADVLIQVASSPTAAQTLANEGAKEYELSPDSSLETPPAIDITGQGPNPLAAIKSAQLVANAIMQDLYQMQLAQHVNKTYMITSIEYIKPTSATSSSTGKLRTMIVVLVIGLILLLVAVSVSQSLEERRKGGRGKREMQERPSLGPNDRYRPSNARNRDHDQSQRPPTPVDNSDPVNPLYRPELQRMQSDRRWD